MSILDHTVNGTEYSLSDEKKMILKKISINLLPANREFNGT